VCPSTAPTQPKIPTNQATVARPTIPRRPTQPHYCLSTRPIASPPTAPAKPKSSRPTPPATGPQVTTPAAPPPMRTPTAVPGPRRSRRCKAPGNSTKTGIHNESRPPLRPTPTAPGPPVKPAGSPPNRTPKQPRPAPISRTKANESPSRPCARSKRPTPAAPWSAWNTCSREWIASRRRSPTSCWWNHVCLRARRWTRCPTQCDTRSPTVPMATLKASALISNGSRRPDLKR
jgi:hypothetical protein